jgi:hypothetical protein
MAETKILKTAKVEDLDKTTQTKLQRFMKSCEADRLYCKISEDRTQILVYADPEKTKFLKKMSVALFHNLHEINS